MTASRTSKSHRGTMAHHSGIAAENAVERYYTDREYAVLARRWRGKSGEIDLVFQSDAGLVFVEVKKSATFESAARQLSPRQQQRILAAATEFVAEQPGGLLTDMRFDVALLDGFGRIEILDNALGCD